MNVPLDIWCEIVSFIVNPKDIGIINESCRWFHQLCLRLFDAAPLIRIDQKTILYGSINLLSLRKVIQDGFNDWNLALVQSAYGGNIDLVKFFTQKGAIRFRRALYKASKKNHLDIVEYIVENRLCGDEEWGLQGASKGGHIKLIQYFIDHGIDKIQAIAIGALRGGHIDILRKYNIGYSNDKPWMIYSALSGGHTSVISSLVEQGATFRCYHMEQIFAKGHTHLMHYVGACTSAYKWDFALRGAATRGDMDSVQFCIQNGASDWNFGLNGAALGGHTHLVDYFIGMGARYWKIALLASIEGGHKDLVEYFFAKTDTSVLNAALTIASSSGQKDLVDYFIARGANMLDISGPINAGYEDIALYLQQKKNTSL